MTTRQSMSEILSKIKTYKSRIENATNHTMFSGSGSLKCDTSFIAVKKNSDTQIAHRPESDVIDEMKSEYASILSLVENLRKLNIIKNAVNDIVTVEIAGDRMTMAQVLSMSNKMLEEYDKAVINKLKQDYNTAIAAIDKYNANVFSDETVNAWVSLYLSQDAATAQKNNPDLVKSAMAYYHEMNDCSLVDPINILEEIKRLEKRYEDLYVNVGFILSAMNARIVVEYDLDSKDPDFWNIINLDELNQIENAMSVDTASV